MCSNLQKMPYSAQKRGVSKNSYRQIPPQSRRLLNLSHQGYFGPAPFKFHFWCIFQNCSTLLKWAGELCLTCAIKWITWIPTQSSDRWHSAMLLVMRVCKTCKEIFLKPDDRVYKQWFSWVNSSITLETFIRLFSWLNKKLKKIQP